MKRKNKMVESPGQSKSKYLFLFSLDGIPNYWDPQPCGANGKEVPLYVVRLHPTREEYMKISDSFLQKANRYTIRKIERIQNPSLFKQYATTKRSMDEQDGSNEKFLYHNTDVSSIPDINQNGLNRSNAGRQGEVKQKTCYLCRT